MKTTHELIETLREMYESAPKDDTVTMIHLFGIMYHKDLQNSNVSKKDIAEKATGNQSYQTEINKGIRLAKYVEIKNHL